MSASSSSESANRISTGPVAFGSVSANAGSSTPAWLWPVLAAGAAVVVVVVILLFKKS